MRLQLRVAPRHGDDRPGIAAMEPADQIAAFLVGMLGHRAAVYHADVRLGIGRDPHETAAFEPAGEGGTLRKIELAAQRMKTDSARRHGIRSVKAMQYYKKIRATAKHPLHSTHAFARTSGAGASKKTHLLLVN